MKAMEVGEWWTWRNRDDGPGGRRMMMMVDVKNGGDGAGGLGAADMEERR